MMSFIALASGLQLLFTFTAVFLCVAGVINTAAIGSYNDDSYRLGHERKRYAKVKYWFILSFVSGFLAVIFSSIGA